MAHLTQNPADKERFICVYPIYINSKKTLAEGRRIPAEKAVENPSCAEIRDVLTAAGMNVYVENKMHPREWNRDVQFRGRVRVQMKQTDGSLCQEKFTSRFLEQLQDLLKDEDPSVRSRTCELLHLVTAHSIGRQAVLSSSLLPPLSHLLDDSSSSCRINALRVLNRLTLLPAGAESLLCLVPKLMLKLQQQDKGDEDDGDDGDEEEVLLLSTISCCSRLDALPALASDGVSLLGRKLSRRSPEVRREAAASLMELSVPVEGKRQVCEGAVLPVVVSLLQDEDVDVRTNAAGVIMNAAIITEGKLLCLDLEVVPVLLDLVSSQWKSLVLYSLRALTALAEAPDGRSLLMQQLPLLDRRTRDQDQDVRRAAQTAVRVVTWTP